MNTHEAIEAMRPHIEKLKRCVRINDEMGRVVYGQTEAITALAEIFDNTEAALSTLPIAGEGKVTEEMVLAAAKAIAETPPEERFEDRDGETFLIRDLRPTAFAAIEAALSALSSSPGKDGGQEVEAVKTVWQVADAIDPERSPDGGWRDQLLSEIHADLENRGRRDKDFAVTVHHRNIVISAVSKALRDLPSASEEQQP